MKISIFTKYCRARKSLTFEQLSKKSDLSKGFLSRLERGDFDNQNISLETIIKLAKGFELKVKEILDSIGIIDSNDPLPLNIYLRKKYNIDDKRDIDFIEDIIEHVNVKKER